MAFSWFLYTTLEPREALKLEDRLRAAVAELIKARPALVRKGGEWGDVSVEDAVPSADDVAELSEAYDRDVSEDVLDRLDACKSAISVERNGASDIDALQVSILRFLLAEVGPSLVDWGDMQIVLSEDVLADLDTFESAGEIGGDVAASAAASAAPSGEAAAAPAPAADTGGLERSTGTEKAMETVAEDPFLQRRFDKLVAKYPDFVRKYVALVAERGAMPDAVAAKELAVARDVLDEQLQKLHDMAKGLAGEADED